MEKYEVLEIMKNGDVHNAFCEISCVGDIKFTPRFFKDRKAARTAAWHRFCYDRNNNRNFKFKIRKVDK